MILPPEAAPLLAALAPHLTHPTDTRLVVLAAAAILTTGRRTVANLLRTVAGLAPGHRTSYQRVLSAAEWSGLALGCALARFLLDHLVTDARSTWSGTTRWTGTRARRCTGRAGIATRSGPATPSPPGGTGTSGWSWPSW